MTPVIAPDRSRLLREYAVAIDGDRGHSKSRMTRLMREAADALDEAEKALQRLASTEGFEGAGNVGVDSFAGRELRARGEFAREALARIGSEA